MRPTGYFVETQTKYTVEGEGEHFSSSNFCSVFDETCDNYSCYRDVTGKDPYSYGLLETVVDTRIAATATDTRTAFLLCPFLAQLKEGEQTATNFYCR